MRLLRYSTKHELVERRRIYFGAQQCGQFMIHSQQWPVGAAIEQNTLEVPLAHACQANQNPLIELFCLFLLDYFLDSSFGVSVVAQMALAWELMRHCLMVRQQCRPLTIVMIFCSFASWKRSAQHLMSSRRSARSRAHNRAIRCVLQLVGPISRWRPPVRRELLDRTVRMRASRALHLQRSCNVRALHNPIHTIIISNQEHHHPIQVFQIWLISKNRRCPLLLRMGGDRRWWVLRWSVSWAHRRRWFATIRWRRCHWCNDGVQAAARVIRNGLAKASRSTPHFPLLMCDVCWFSFTEFSSIICGPYTPPAYSAVCFLFLRH